ncbi:hypothetical protein GCM10023115_23730 [Pontixanthobacter gangjinensis]|nr:hypothetical protein [Pontixanthobacter gangjinensis]
MPIWFELMVLLLAAYAIGLIMGWLIWGRTPDEQIIEIEEDTTL